MMHRFCCACLRRPEQGRADPHEAYFHPEHNQANGAWQGDRVGIAEFDPTRRQHLSQQQHHQGLGQRNDQVVPNSQHQAGDHGPVQSQRTPRREDQVNPTSSESDQVNDRMQIHSAVKEKDVEYLDKTPEDGDDLITHPFECPICYRFSDHILHAHCCRQYICHTCALRLHSGFIRSSCPHCRTQPLVLVDPTPTDPVRCYRDSPTKVGRQIEWMNIVTTAVAKEGKGPAKKFMPNQQGSQNRVGAVAGGA